MSASTGDKITDVRNGSRPTTATVTTARSINGTNLACNDLSGWPTASKIHFVIYQIDTNSNPVAGTQLDCSGIVSGNTITQLSVLDGTDGGSAIGDIVEMLPTASWAQDLSDALTNEHSRTGTHTAVTATSLTTTGSITSGNDVTITDDLTVGGDIAVTGDANFKANSLLKADLEKPHVGGLLCASDGGTVFQNIQVMTGYDTAYSGTYGMTVNTSTKIITIARDGLYQVNMHFKCIDVAASAFITWLWVNRSGSSFAMRRQDQAIGVGQGDCWSFTIPLLAGDEVYQQVYNGGGATRFGNVNAGTQGTETARIMGMSLMVTEIR